MDTGSVRLQRIWAFTMSPWAADSNTSSKRVETMWYGKNSPQAGDTFAPPCPEYFWEGVLFLVLSENCIKKAASHG